MESMDDYKEELEASFRKVREGDLMTGTVIGISDNEAILDLKYYTEGVIRAEDFSNDPSFCLKEEISIGDVITATVINPDEHGHILLSKKEANETLAWDKLEQYQKDKNILTVKIQEVVNAGVITYVEGIRGFIPASKLSLEYVEDLDTYLGQKIQVQVLTADKINQKLILSAKELLKEKQDEIHRQSISNLEVGLVTEGTVESLQPYGAFINIGHGLTGLLHISQIGESRIKHPSVVLKEGQKVKVKIIQLKDDKISLSMKALQDVAAKEIEEETIELPEAENAYTSLGSLFKNLKL